MDEAGGGQTGYGDAKSDSFPQATTRVLTDNSGHSIKIRLASPPPQRQAALLKMHQSAREQQLQKQQRQQQQDTSCVISLPLSEADPTKQHKELPSISATLSSTSICLNDDDDDDADADNDQEPSDSCFSGEQHSTTLRRYLKTPEPNQVHPIGSNNLREASARERRNDGRGVDIVAGSDCVIATSCSEDIYGKQLRSQVRDTSSDNYDSSPSEATLVDSSSSLGNSISSLYQNAKSSQTNVESPNETTFGRSHGSDQAGWDSRQDTSLDFCPANFWQQQREQLLNFASLKDNSVGNNDTVMDVDLRCANRLNLELLMMQNTALHNMMKSSTNFGPGFPQSGILPTASEHVAALQQVACQTGGGEQLASYEDLIEALQRQLNSNSGSENNSSTSGQIIHTGDVSGADDRPESRRSSSEVSQISTPFGNTPSLKILVKPLKRAENVSDSNKVAQQQAKKSILGRILSFELGSSESLVQEMDKSVADKRNIEDTLFEIHLLEVLNLMPKQRQVIDKCVLPSVSSGSRRTSVEGLFVRVFKRQGRDLLVPSTMDSQSGVTERQQSFCGSSSLAGGKEQLLLKNHRYSHQENHLQCADFIQLPLIKTSCQEDRINLAELSGAYKFVCSSSELPLRISLYKTSKKANARYTLGHCLISANFWSMLCPASKDENNDGGLKRLSNSSALSEARSSGSSEAKFVMLAGSELNEEDGDSEQTRNEQRTDKSFLFEFRLFQTILEAVS